ncbi:MAG TPA: c-type cytochrome [Nevskiaceae bacterium]|nr:c-type cytochrome [Nevskiaceae bacterium]
MIAKLVPPLALLIALTACGKQTPAPPTAMDGGSAARGRMPEPPDATGAAAPAATTAAAPSDPNLAKLFHQTCEACHTHAGTGAPQAGDRNAWAPRLAQGMPTLLQHAINGYKGMPPMGSCMDCSEADFEALIKFMAGAQ